MTGLRVMQRLACENDAGGRFTDDPGRDSQRHGPRFLCGCCGSPGSARSAGTHQARRLGRERPPGPRAWYGRGAERVFTRPAPALGGRSRSKNPWREGHRAPHRMRRINGAGRRPGLDCRRPSTMPCRPWPCVGAQTIRCTVGPPLRLPSREQQLEAGRHGPTLDVESAPSRSGIAVCYSTTSDRVVLVSRHLL